MIRKFIVFLVALFGLSLPLAAFAGKVEFRDEAALLSTPMRDSIVTRALRWSFSTRVLVSSSSATRSAFERRAIDALNAADMLVIGIDPVHRYTVVRMGMGLSLETNAYSQIASAGNSSFKDRLWADGIGAIGDKAQSSIAYADYIRNTRSMEMPARPPVRGLATQSQVPVRPARSSDAGRFIDWWLLGLIVSLIIICSVVAIIARRREAAASRRARQALIDAEADRILNADRRRDSISRDEAAAPVAPMPSRYQSAPREPSYAAPPRMVAPVVAPAPAPAPIVQHVYHQPAPPPAPVVIHQDRTDGLITGMLLNEAMHSSHHHHDRSDRHVVVERVVEVEREPQSRSYDGGGASSSRSTPEPAQDTSYSSSSSSSFESSSSYDAGGSSSSWDSGSSSSSFDSSSSSSSFDSGGGSSDF